MKFKVGKKSIEVAVILLILAAGVAGIWYAAKNRGPAQGSQERLDEMLKSEDTKNDLERGSCSDSTKGKLRNIDEGADPNIVAQAYETRGLCLVYSNDLESAKVAYEKAKEFYEKANDEISTARLQGSIESIDAIKAESSRDKPGPDADPKDYPESEGGT